MSWRGLNKHTGMAISDAEHIKQSIQDILTTPVGSRVMRRDYGSDLFELIDQPQDLALRLRLMAATVMALTAWEPRIRITHIDIQPAQTNGRLAVTLTAERADQNRSMIAEDYTVIV